MDLLPSPIRHICRSPDHNACLERGLVLQAAGIKHDIQQTDDGFVLEVAGVDVDRAVAELNDYAGESPEVPSAAEPVTGRSSGWSGVMAYAAVLLLIALFQHNHAFSSDWLAVGKNSAGLVRDGQWWRTITALTLHLDAAHMAANLVFGSLFGLFAGRLLGSGLAWAGILAAGAIGNAANAWLQPADQSSAGASTAVFAALGILLGSTWPRRPGTEAGWVRRWTPALGGILLLAWIGAGGERTDIMAHVTGFTAGLLLGWLLRSLQPRLIVSTGIQAAAGVVALWTLAVCWLLALRT